jgi:LuxR family maltose regulon positive regulatory protein
MARLDPTIRHAITPPEFDEGKLHRERLVDRLHGEVPKRLVAIAAPAGYGKTTLLADFVAHTEMPVCWLQLSSSDQDVMRLASALYSSMEYRFRRLRDQFDLRAFAGSSPVELARAIGSLIEENIPETFVLILDDTHVIQNSERSLAFLDSLIMELPEQAVVFAAGREVLEVSLARLMANGELAGFGPQDLALDREETRAILSQEGTEPTLEQVEQVIDKSKGWVAGIVLTRNSGTRSALAGALPENLAYEYLGSVVLNRQSEDVRAFLLESSVLPVMTAELCDSVLGREDSAEMLDSAMSKGLFVTKTASNPETYEYHPMFRGLLAETLSASNPDRYVFLQERSGDVLTDINPEAAIEVLLSAGLVDKAADVVEGISEETFTSGRYTTLENWISRFDEPVSLVPSAVLYMSIAEIGRGMYEKALAGLDEVQSSSKLSSRQLAIAGIHKCSALTKDGQLQDAEVALGEARNLVRESESELLRGRLLRVEADLCLLSDSDLDRPIDLLEGATEIFAVSGNRYLQMATLLDLSRAYGRSGMLVKAGTASENALKIAQEFGSPLSLSIASNQLAQVDYLSGSYEEALRGFVSARSHAARAANPNAEALAIFGQAEVFADVGLKIQSAEACEEAIDLAAKAGDPYWLAYGCLTSSILHRRSGSYRLAGEWVKRGYELGNGLLKVPLDIQSAAIIASSAPARAIEALRALLVGEGSALDAQQEALAYLFLAYALYVAGDPAEAEAEYRKCLATVSLKNAAQFVAPELRVLDGFREWASGKFEEDPVHAMLLNRVDLMDKIMLQYRPDGASVSESGILVRAMGKSKIAVDGTPVDGLKPQAAEVFYLLVDRGPMERDAIAETFWRDYPAGRQTANLHMAIYSIRAALGKEVVSLDGSVYGVGSDIDIRYDVTEFERAATVVKRLPPGDPRRIFALTEAVNLYSGKFLPEFFSDWIIDRRRDLEFLYLDVASEHADEALVRNQPLRAIGTLRDALAVDPYRDDLNERYIEALGRLNRRSELVSHFSKYERLLREDLGLEPSSNVRIVYERAVGGTS